MLRKVLNISWKESINNVDVCGNIPMPSVMIENRRMKMAGHIARHEDLLANKVGAISPKRLEIQVKKQKCS